MRCVLLLAVVLMAGLCPAQVLLPTTPTWASTETELNGTGLDIGDVDGDGWLDLAVSNGNDITQSPNFIYHNQGGGVLPAAATWVSSDHRYSGHCQLADVDGDGYPELMVANYIGPGWGFGQVQVYDNVAGVLQTSPSWTSPTEVHTFRAVFGDPDGDGDLDLAVATGEAYHQAREANLVFFNEGGVLQAQAGWRSDVLDMCYDAKFVDFDGDGDQDLAFLGGSDGVVSVYRNHDGLLETTPSWTTAGNDNGNTFDFDDLDHDGRPDLLVGYNSQLSGSGRFAVFLSAGGELPTVPSWTSAFQGYGSAVVCADIDRDGHVDLLAGGWWEPVRVYLNQGGGVFPAEPDWQTAAATVVENLALADLDAGAEVARVHSSAMDGGGLVELPHRHLQGIDAVRVDGMLLAPTQYCSSLRDGWVSVGVAGATVEVSYRQSDVLDLALSNWDTASQVHESDLPTSAGAVPMVLVRDTWAQPNPFNPRTEIHVDLADRAGHVSLRIFDVRGRLVDSLREGAMEAGHHRLPWSPQDLAGGVYIYRLVADGEIRTGKVVLAR